MTMIYLKQTVVFITIIAYLIISPFARESRTKRFGLRKKVTKTRITNMDSTFVVRKDDRNWSFVSVFHNSASLSLHSYNTS